MRKKDQQPATTTPSPQADFDVLKAKSQEASADAKICYEKKASSIREKLQNAQEKASEIQEASEDSWDNLRQGADDAWEKAKDALESAKAKFK